MFSRSVALLPFAILSLTLPAAAESQGRQDFVELCAGCHGEDARGNGPDSANLSTPAPDLTLISQRFGGTFDDKTIFDWIVGLKDDSSHGARDMPIWGDWLMDEEMEDSTSLQDARAAEKRVEARVMGIVRYLKTIQRTE